jgi:anti-anti-sigma factor
MPFSIVSLQTNVTRIALEGELDVITAEVLRPELAGVLRRRPTQVEVELSRLKSAHTRGMDVLVSFFASLARAGCRITIVGLQHQPLKSFKAALVDAIRNVPGFVN